MSDTPPSLLDHLDEVLPLVRLERLGLIVDFDGTISEIVPVPGDAKVTKRSAAALGRLSESVALVAVVTGRAVRDVSDRVGLRGVVYVGNHGAEYLADGDLSVVPGAGSYREALVALLDHLRSSVSLPGLIWQDKGYSASVHYRLAADPEAVKSALTAGLRSAPGAGELQIFWGKLLLELRAPTGLDKGYAVRKLCDDWGVDGAIVIGDDRTDVDALRALRALVAEGRVRGVAVSVLAPDSPEELIASADYTLAGVAEVEEFVEWLADAPG